MALEDRRREWFQMGRVFRRTWDSLREMPQLSLAISGLFVVLPEAVVAVLLSLQNAEAGGLSESGFNIPLGLISLFGQTALVHAALNRQIGKTVTIGSSLSAAGGLFLPIWGLSILTGLGLILGFLLLIIPGLYLMTLWVVAIPARIMNGPGVRDAMSASAELTKGVRWQVFGLILLAGLIVGGCLVSVLAAAASLPAGLELLGTAVLAPVALGLTTVIFAYGSAALYHELKWGSERGPAETTAELFD